MCWKAVAYWCLSDWFLRYVFARTKYKGHYITNPPNALREKKSYDFALLDPPCKVGPIEWSLKKIRYSWHDQAICSILWWNISPLFRTTFLSWYPHISWKDSGTYFGGTVPYKAILVGGDDNNIGRIHTAYIGEDSSILGTLEVKDH